VLSGLGVSAAGTAAQALRQGAAVHALAVSGARLWVMRYNGHGNGADSAAKVAVSSDGSTVYVTGTSAAATSKADYATIAYNTATGTRLWVARYTPLATARTTPRRRR
jgi:DNA-binding beta-propeller fold protein YncE